MRILVLHNTYQQQGGEDTVVEQEADLLCRAGHEVRVELFSNDSISGPLSKLRAAMSVTGNSFSARIVSKLCAEFNPDVVHIHNFFPMLSPSAHIAASNSGAAVVQTLHNYRLVCAGAMLLRDGNVCEDCLGTSGSAALRHRCYRNSVPGTAAVLLMQRATVGSERWLDNVDRLIALTDFSRDLFVEAGLPADKIFVKPNFVSGIEAGPAMGARSSGAIFVGRLSPEKGVHHLVEAWRALPDVPLTIIGDGPARKWLEANAPPHVSLIGALSRAEVIDHMRSARLLVFPSLWYEGFPMTIAEALACGTPIIAANIGAAREIVSNGGFGHLYPPGDGPALAAAVRRFFAGDMEAMSQGARARYETLYSPKRNLELLERVYAGALNSNIA